MCLFNDGGVQFLKYEELMIIAPHFRINPFPVLIKSKNFVILKRSFMLETWQFLQLKTTLSLYRISKTETLTSINGQMPCLTLLPLNFHQN